MFIAAPLLPIVILLAGVAVLLLFGLPLRLRASGPVAALFALAATAALFALRGQLPVMITLSEWRPATLLSSPLTFYMDGLGWVFALALLLLTAAALLTGLSRAGGHRAQMRAVMLLMAAAALAALFSGTLLTLCLAWTAFDLLYLMITLSSVEREHAGEHAIFTAMLNGAATLMLWAVALIIQVEGGTQYLHLASFTPAQTTLLVVAAVFRLGLYPLHLWLPSELELRPGLSALLHIVPATLGITLLARLALVGDSVAGLGGQLTIAGGAALAVGAILAWGQDDYRHTLSFVLLIEAGVTVLAGIWSGVNATLLLVSEGLVLILGVGLLFLGRAYDARRPWLSLPSAIAVLALLGAPATLGFVTRALLFGGYVAAGQWTLLVLSAVVQAILLDALVRAVARSAMEDPPQGGVLVAATVVGELLLAVPLVLLGALPDQLARFLDLETQPTLANLLAETPWPVWSALVLAVLGGVLVFRYDRGLRSVRGTARPWLTALLSLRWLYRLLLQLFGALTVLVRAVAGLLEGEGAWLWTVIVLLLAWLYLNPLK
jgi:formate hydrogenlyase subunit 3/multisubunit Na+/H+ antiporter MnhD subunit